MTDENWKAADFGRRAYYIKDEDGSLANAKIELILKINGKVEMQLQLREPGIIALVSRPDEEGIRAEIVEPGGVRYTDVLTPEGLKEQRVQPWQQIALGFEDGV